MAKGCRANTIEINSLITAGQLTYIATVAKDWFSKIKNLSFISLKNHEYRITLLIYIYLFHKCLQIYK